MWPPGQLGTRLQGVEADSWWWLCFLNAAVSANAQVWGLVIPSLKSRLAYPNSMVTLNVKPPNLSPSFGATS